MIKKFNKGSELDKQIYKEGESTWGLKSGFLDVEDVKEFIKWLKKYFVTKQSRKFIDSLAGDKLI